MTYTLPQSKGDNGEVDAQLVACLQTVSSKVQDADKVLSRWNLEILLDELASTVSTYLSSKLPSAGPIGCSIIYGLLPRSYYVGGASRDRRKMEFEARYYDLEDDWLKSFTAFSLVTRTEFLLDDFDTACVQLRGEGLRHDAKDCETPASRTRSYCCIPIPREGPLTAKHTLRSARDFQTLRHSDSSLDRCIKSNMLPGAIGDPLTAADDYSCGALRFTSQDLHVASQIRSILSETVWHRTLLEDLGSIVRSGVSKAGGSDKEAVLLKVLADFLQQLPDWRGSEFYAFNQLTLLLQCMFDACEVSVFEAHREARQAGRDIVNLRLAATTALSDKPGSQHAKFRDRFYAQDSCYPCYFESGTNTPIPGVTAVKTVGKTARAYYMSPQPYFIEADTRSASHHGFNEIAEGQTASFLAFAIPPPKDDSYSLSYGVVRIVSGHRNVLTKKHKELAGAVGAGLRLLWEHFPCSQQLEVLWLPPEGQSVEERAAGALKELVDEHATDRVVAREFALLLRKLFFDHTTVTILACVVAGPSELRLNVRLDDDADDGVIIRRKHKSERYVRLARQDWRETRNLIGRITSTESALWAPMMRRL